MKRIAVLGMAIFCLAACNQTKLAKEQAATIIRSEKAYPKVYEYEVNTADPAGAKRLLDAGLESDGLVSIDQTQKLGDAGEPIVHFTDKAKPYLLRKNPHYNNVQVVKVADMDLGKITGIQIQDNNKKAIVEYTVVYKNITPFGKLIHRDLTQPETAHASLTLFDTGWKLDKRR